MDPRAAHNILLQDFLKQVLALAHDPALAKEAVCEQLRQLAAARMVLVVEKIDGGGLPDFVIQPAHRRVQAGADMVDGFCRYMLMFHQPHFWERASDTSDAAIASYGIENCLSMPLLAAEKSMGTLLIFDCTLTDNLPSIKETLEMLSGVLGLILRNAESHLEAEKLVVARTAELEKNMVALALQARRTAALLELPQAAERLDETAFMQRGLELAEELTGSLISFCHFVNSDAATIELITWSRRTQEQFCTAVYDKHYPIEQAGIWADAFHRRRPVIFNDYAACPYKHGLPEGHAGLQRLISLPVMKQGKAVALLGVGNKKADYDDLDVETVQLIADSIWRIVQRKRAEEQIKAQLDELLRWQEATLGREDRVQEIKREVNELCRRLGEPVRYPSQEAGAADSGETGA